MKSILLYLEGLDGKMEPSNTSFLNAMNKSAQNILLAPRNLALKTGQNLLMTGQNKFNGVVDKVNNKINNVI